MHKLDESAVTQWTSQASGLRVPASFTVTCPHCNERANFGTSDFNAEEPRNTISATARCAACQGAVFIWNVREKDLYMDPPPPLPRQPIAGAELMPDAIRRAYQDTINVYNAKVWSASATMTRRTLEGIVNNLLPNETGPLAQQIGRLADTVDLQRPLITLSH